MAWLSTKVVERSILHYTNKERRKRGLLPLSGNRALAKAARGHSRWMSKTGALAIGGREVVRRPTGRQGRDIGMEPERTSG